MLLALVVDYFEMRELIVYILSFADLVTSNLYVAGINWFDYVEMKELIIHILTFVDLVNLYYTCCTTILSEFQALPNKCY